MAIVFNGTTMTSIKFNGTTIRSIVYNGTTYCISCSYSSSSCGSLCRVSTKSVCNNSTCIGAMGLSRAVTQVNKMMARNRIVLPLIGKIEMTEQSVAWREAMDKEYEDWKESYETYFGNDEIPQQEQNEFKRIYEEIKQDIELDNAVIQSDVDRKFPDAINWKINYEEKCVDVYGNRTNSTVDDTADE